MFSKDLEFAIGQCYKHAREARHEYMTVEHLLLALIDNPSAESVLKACGVDFQRLRADLEHAISTSVSTLPEGDARDTQATLGFQRVLQRAVYHVQSSGKTEVAGANVLVAIFGEKDSYAVYYLNQQGVTRLDVVNFLSHGITKAGLRPRAAELATVDLSALAQDVIARENAFGRVTVDIPAGLTARADAPLLTRALANLVRNAMRYAGDASPIALAARAESGAVIVTVDDEGPGVPPEALARLGEPFYRPESARTRRPP